jgi:exopolyphosphatase/guanosine-5'-triphosphate,3'-diphosphate pyrophosphatase
MSGVVPKLSWKTTAEGLELVIDKSKADLIGDVPEGRLQQLARLTGKNIKMVIS